MKAPFPSVFMPGKSSFTSRSQSGAALVIVLASLIFLAVLAVAFLTSIGTELKSSKRYADAVSVQLLSQSAFNLGVAQITEATKGVDSNNKPLAWASQPGMIRTYDSKGRKQQYYRLYSWDVLAGTGDVDLEAERAALDGWDSPKALFTDMNEPLKIGGTVLYPILDGNGLRTNLTDGAKAIPGQAYDIDHDGVWDLEGFNINKIPATSSDTNPVPMPVKWLYVLQDGEIVPSTPAGTNEVKVAGATSENPIVGRIAFWTDDESSKINVNTASEGTYADSPRAGVESKDDSLLGYNQPVAGEYQRYPGHPAMTSLRTVFPLLTADQIFGIVPRIGTGGSNSGATRTAMLPSAVPPMLPDSDRLYASIDELMFTKDRKPNDPAPANPQIIKKETLERAKFFLTANSRSPDLNLFGKPRVNIWPIHVTDTPAFRTPFDRAIAFCSTMRSDLSGSDGPYDYFFQREDANDPTHDLPAASVTGLGRNRMLLDYLKEQASKDIPGFGGNFAAKYNATDVASVLPSTTTELDQILVEIFDYIRCTNLRDSQLAAANTFTPSIPGPIAGQPTGFGQVVPIEDSVSGARGFGRFRTVKGGSFLFIGQVDGDVPASQVDITGAPLLNPAVPPAPPLDREKTKVPAGSIRIQSIFLPQIYDVAVGVVFSTPRIHLAVTGLDTFTWDAGDGPESMGLPALIEPDSLNKWVIEGAGFGDQLGIRQMAGDSYVSKTLDVVKSRGYFNFSGGKVTLTFSTIGSPSKVVQTVVLDFPPARIPLPTLASGDAAHSWGSPPNYRHFNLRFFKKYLGPGFEGGRIATTRDTMSGVGKWVFETDVVRSVGVTSGDVRLVSARKDPPLPGTPHYQFSKTANYGDASTKNPATYLGTHTMWTANGFPVPGAVPREGSLGDPPPGKLAKDAPYGLNLSSDIPATINGIAVGKATSITPGDVPGDYDNGVGQLRDGPFINKPDEGDRGSYPVNWPYFWKDFSGSDDLNASLFTPNRMIASPVTFGSLPTGVLADKPWQTLLFRPGPANHPGLGLPVAGSPPYTTPPDHLLLDLFHMPVVEPYAISEPFSTAGRINMNYQIMPFTYINRDTGLRAVLKSERVISMTNDSAKTYKQNNSPTPPVLGTTRQDVNVAGTIAGIARRLNAGDLYRSASEICDIDIIPVNYTGVIPATRESMDAYWNTRLVTGDNSRERPYATIYPRLTTQSNVYTIHVRVQTLKKVPGTPVGTWVENRDQVTGEYRGYQTIERFIDPNDKRIPDYANPSDQGREEPISKMYKVRVVTTKQFAP